MYCNRQPLFQLSETWRCGGWEKFSDVEIPFSVEVLVVPCYDQFGTLFLRVDRVGTRRVSEILKGIKWASRINGDSWDWFMIDHDHDDIIS